jgi:hypothetical protein
MSPRARSHAESASRRPSETALSVSDVGDGGNDRDARTSRRVHPQAVERDRARIDRATYVTHHTNLRIGGAIISVASYFGCGALVHLLLVGQTFRWDSALTWACVFAWPLTVVLAALAICAVITAFVVVLFALYQIVDVLFTAVAALWSALLTKLRTLWTKR